jgi:hypothetical protein
VTHTALPHYLTTEDLAAGLDYIRESPTDCGTLELLVRRPAIDAREIVEEGQLDLEVGLIGDNWKTKGSTTTPDGSSHPDGQLALINARLAKLVAGSLSRASLAGDQLYVDLDLSEDGLPAGTRLGIGDAVIEITAKPHLGCAKFAARFGPDALRFVNIGVGRQLNLRGRHARVIVPGTIRQGDRIERLPANAGGRRQVAPGSPPSKQGQKNRTFGR